MRHKALRKTNICIIIQLFFLTFPWFFVSWFLSWFLILIVSTIFGFSHFNYGSKEETWFYIIWSVITILGTIILDIVSYLYLKMASLMEALSNGYRRSIKEALQAEYPEGVVYILDNILKQFDKFSLNLPPYQIPYTQGYSINNNNNNYDNISTSTGISYVKGFPNRTNLREAMNMAQALSEEWSNLNPAEKSRAMGEIRAKIEKEDMLLGIEGHGRNLKNKSHLPVYWFSYTEEDPIPQTPTSKIKPPVNPPQVLNFDEWINQNPVIQRFSKQVQIEAYQRYLQSIGVNNLSFEEWLDQNPALQYFSEEQQREAYENYLSS
jgi:hypothetical protein